MSEYSKCQSCNVSIKSIGDGKEYVGYLSICDPVTGKRHSLKQKICGWCDNQLLELDRKLSGPK